MVVSRDLPKGFDTRIKLCQLHHYCGGKEAVVSRNAAHAAIDLAAWYGANNRDELDNITWQVLCDDYFTYKLGRTP